MKSLPYTLVFSSLLAGLGQAADSAYTPTAGGTEITTGYQFSTRDHFWEGTHLETLKNGTGGAYETKEQHVFALALSYGITDTLSIDANSGYVWTQFSNGGPDDNGIIDTTIGLRYAFANEAAGAPLQVAVHVGGIIAGGYNADDLFSVGQGENGWEGSLLLGKRINDNFGIFGDIGYRWYANDVPDLIYGSAGAYVNIGPATLTASYNHSQSLSGGDIGGPGFGTKFGVPGTKQISKGIEVGLGFADDGGRYYQIYYARTLDGRNVDQRDTIGVSITIPFGGGSAPAMMDHAPMSSGK